MSITMTMTQPAHTQQRFVDQSASYHFDGAGPDPELKKILPLVFASIGVQSSPGQDDSELFAPIFIDNSNGQVRNSVSAQKVLPIAADNLIGISTYFSRFHPGIDYRAHIGTSILAVLPGVVNEVGYEPGGYGRYVILVHHVDGQTLFTLYAHMRKTNVITGDVVDAGEKIGEVGLTGHTTGPHLHFELHNSNIAMDPMIFFAGNNLAMATRD